MRVALEPTTLYCDSTLSSAAAPWGKGDGLRLFFFVETGSGKFVRMVSSNDPLGSSSGSWLLTDGEQIALSQYPPDGGSSWSTGELVIEETETVSIVVVGVNEGWDYIAGGGGSDPVIAAVLAILVGATALAPPAKSFSGKLMATIAKGKFKSLIDLTSKIDASSEDCSGVAFAYKQTFTGTDLLLRCLPGRGRTTVNWDLSQIPVAPGCSTPAYRIDVLLRLLDPVDVEFSDQAGSPVSGEPSAYRPASNVTPCNVDGIAIWPVSTNRTLTFKYPARYRLLDYRWSIGGQALTSVDGSVSLVTTVERFPEFDPAVESVTLWYRREDDDTRLVIETEGGQGNFSVPVALELTGSGGVLRSFKSVAYVVGQEVAGNDRYAEWKDCVAAFSSTIDRIGLRYRAPIRLPGLPSEPIATIREIARLSAILKGDA